MKRSSVSNLLSIFVAIAAILLPSFGVAADGLDFGPSAADKSAMTESFYNWLIIIVEIIGWIALLLCLISLFAPRVRQGIWYYIGAVILCYCFSYIGGGVASKVSGEDPAYLEKSQ